MLPELNYMVVNKRSWLPGKAMLSRWIDMYGNVDGYKEYCELRAKESLRFLKNKWIIFSP
jgi:hypothetical protein